MEFGVLTEIVFMMVPGSVATIEDERCFSAMEFNMDKVRNQLDAHLPFCVHGIKPVALLLHCV